MNQTVNSKSVRLKTDPVPRSTSIPATIASCKRRLTTFLRLARFLEVSCSLVGRGRKRQEKVAMTHKKKNCNLLVNWKRTFHTRYPITVQLYEELNSLPQTLRWLRNVYNLFSPRLTRVVVFGCSHRMWHLCFVLAGLRLELWSRHELFWETSWLSSVHLTKI
jgi:hypothetical protein